MEKKTLLAILLSAAVWIVWFSFVAPPPDSEKIASSRVPEIEKNKETNSKNKSNSFSSQKTNLKISEPKSNNIAQDFSLETDKFKFTLSNKGAVIKSVFYKERELNLDVKTNPFKAKGLFDFALHFNEYEFLAGNVLDETVWTFDKIDNYQFKFFTDLYLDSQLIQIEKIYLFYENKYDFKLTYRFINKSKQAFLFKDKSVIISPTDILGPKLNYKNTYNHLSSIYSLGDDFNQIHKGGGFFSKESNPVGTKDGPISWVGVMSRYFLCLMVPEDFTGQKIGYDNRVGRGFRTGIYLNLESLQPQEHLQKSFKIYLGLKDKDTLTAVDKRIKEAADVSKWIEPIRWIVMWSLLSLNKIFGNLGWSLVVFSLLTKIIFMPLTIKSTNSMKKMQSLSPKINELKKKYKDKPDVMQREIMKMYKEHKVNPMGGCFPMLLQMPFFFALYSALINSIDLWQAPFMLWIKDLSMPDTIMTISGFNLNILPIIMTGSTFLQQKLTTVDTGQGQQQKIMMMLMPLIFIFIFWNMPSGLVLYWTLQNLFQVAHQLYINKKKSQKEV